MTMYHPFPLQQAMATSVVQIIVALFGIITFFGIINVVIRRRRQRTGLQTLKDALRRIVVLLLTTLAVHQLELYHWNLLQETPEAFEFPFSSPFNVYLPAFFVPDTYTPPCRLFRPQDSYYKILGLHSSATVNEVRSTYRALARTLHPDKRKDVDHTCAQEDYILAQHAYETLTDEWERCVYDCDVVKTFGAYAWRWNQEQRDHCYWCSEARYTWIHAGMVPADFGEGGGRGREVANAMQRWLDEQHNVPWLVRQVKHLEQRGREMARVLDEEFNTRIMSQGGRHFFKRLEVVALSISRASANLGKLMVWWVTWGDF